MAVGLASEHLIVFIVGLILAACVFTLTPITIIAIVRTPSLRRSHSNIFLINLALVDLLLVLLVITFTAHFLASEISKTACLIGIVYFGTIATASMLSSFAIAFDRFLFIHNALRYPVIVTQRRVTASVLIIWMSSLFIGIIPLLDSVLIEENSCQHPRSKALNIQDCIVVSLFFTTGIVSVCLYAKLFFIIRQHNKVLETHARAHCLHHDCRKQECRLKSSLGECRFRSCTSATHLDWKSEDPVDKNNRDDSIADSSFCTGRNASTVSPSPDEITQDTSISLSFGDEPSSTAESSTQPSTQLMTPCNKECTCRDNNPKNKTNPNQRDNDESKMAATIHNSLTCTKKEKRPKRVRLWKCQHLRDLRTIKTLMLMFIIYFVCWAPLVSMRILTHLHNLEINNSLFYSACIIAISNSLWNFLVYPFRKKELRRAIFRMLRCSAGHSFTRQQNFQHYMCHKHTHRRM